MSDGVELEKGHGDDPSRVEPYVVDFCLVRGGNVEVQGGPDA